MLSDYVWKTLFSYFIKFYKSTRDYFWKELFTYFISYSTKSTSTIRQDMRNQIRCHYEVLGVERDADLATIKKSHRKLALRWHPDKNLDNHDEALVEFRLVQEAYECLSDPVERRWYDDHREVILKGWTAGDRNNSEQQDIDILFDITPYMYAGCYNGYDDDNIDDSFYSVYNMVFRKILEGENVGEHDDESKSNSYLPTDFGNSQSSWQDVFAFYQAWESFSSSLSFAWADEYNINEATNRNVRRAIQEENRKCRRAAKRERNDDILALVHFVKRRDPRVKARKLEIEAEKRLLEEKAKEEALRRKQEIQEARSQWRTQAEEAMAIAEEEDRKAGRIRLADLEDDYDYSGKRGKGKRKSKKKGKEILDTNEHSQSNVESVSNDNENNPNNCENEDKITESIIPDNNATTDSNPPEELENSSEFIDDVTDSSQDSSSEDEPDVWRCECCRKDFKSKAQMENHFKSKKHKETYKKYQKHLEKIDQEILHEILDEE